MKVLYGRKVSLEQELTKIEASEKSKYLNYLNLERLCQHMKQEIELLRNELELKEISK